MKVVKVNRAIPAVSSVSENTAQEKPKASAETPKLASLAFRALLSHGNYSPLACFCSLSMAQYNNS